MLTGPSTVSMSISREETNSASGPVPHSAHEPQCQQPLQQRGAQPSHRGADRQLHRRQPAAGVQTHRGCDPLLPGRTGPISGTRSISCAASAVRTAGPAASTLHSALRIAEANGVTSGRDTAIAAISAGVKLSGGKGSVLSTT